MDKRRRLLHFAEKNLGKPYKYGAKPHEAPKLFDCSSFIQYLYKRIGVKLPRTALAQASIGKTVEPKKESLEVGDLLFLKGSWGHYNPDFPIGIGHVGIYVGNGKVINARFKNSKGKGLVIKEDLETFLNREDFVIGKRIV